MKVADESITIQTKTNDSLIREVQLCQKCQTKRREALLMTPICQIVVQQSQLCQECSHGYIVVVHQELDIQAVLVSIYQYCICKKCRKNDYCKSLDIMRDANQCHKCQQSYQLFEYKFNLFQKKCPLCNYDQCLICNGSLELFGFKKSKGRQCFKCKKWKHKIKFYTHQISMLINLFLVAVLGIFYTFKWIQKHNPPWYMWLLFGIGYYIYWIGKAVVLLMYCLILGMKRGEMVLVQL